MRLQLTAPGTTIRIMKRQKTLCTNLLLVVSCQSVQVDVESWILEAPSCR